MNLYPVEQISKKKSSMKYNLFSYCIVRNESEISVVPQYDEYYRTTDDGNVLCSRSGTFIHVSKLTSAIPNEFNFPYVSRPGINYRQGTFIMKSNGLRS